MDKFTERAIRANKIVLKTILAGSMYVGTMIGVQSISERNSPDIESESHLEQILEEEKTRAGIDRGNQVEVIVTDDAKAYPRADKVADGKYEIILPSDKMNLSTLRHELYHIADGHCDSRAESNSGAISGFTYLFWNEPQATIYEATGLKP